MIGVRTALLAGKSTILVSHEEFFFSCALAVLGSLHNPPLKVASLSRDRCVVLCGRELRVYDINSGEEVLKLKGEYCFYAC